MPLRIISNDKKSRPEIEKKILLKNLVNSMYPALLYFTKNLTNDTNMALNIVEEVIGRDYQETRNLIRMDPRTLYQKVISVCLKSYQSKFQAADLKELQSKIEYWVCRTEILRNCHDSLLHLPKFCRKLRYLEFVERMKNSMAPGK